MGLATPKFKRRVVVNALVALGISFAGSLTAISASSAAHVQDPSTKTVKPDLSYFAGKTINYIVPTAVGAGSYSTAVLFAPLMASFLHATINISSNAGGGGYAGQDVVAASPADGLTIGTLSLNTDVSADIVNQPNVNFSLQKIKIIGCVPLNPAVIGVNPATPFQTINDLLKTTSNPIVLDYSSTAFQLEQVLYGAYGTQVHYVAGYGNSSAVLAGFLRGDGPVLAISVPAFVNAIVAGQARPLLVSSAPVAGSLGYDQLKSLPTLGTYYAKHKPKTPAGRAAIKELIDLDGPKALNNCPFAPAGTPPREMAALGAAFKYAMKQPSLKAQMITEALTPGYYSAATSEQVIRTAVKHASIIGRFLNT